MKLSIQKRKTVYFSFQYEAFLIYRALVSIPGVLLSVWVLQEVCWYPMSQMILEHTNLKII